MGKKLERTLFFPFPFLYFLTTFFPVFGENRQKRVKKGLERRKKAGKMWNGEERPFHAVPNCRIWRDSVFYAVKNQFLTPFQPVFYPVPNPFLPLSTPVLAPFLYCLAIISRCVLVAAQPLDHVGSSPVHGPMEVLYSWRGDAKDQFARYVCSHAWEQAKRRHQEGEGAGCALCQEEERLNAPDDRGGRGGEGETQS